MFKIFKPKKIDYTEVIRKKFYKEKYTEDTLRNEIISVINNSSLSEQEKIDIFELILFLFSNTNIYTVDELDKLDPLFITMENYIRVTKKEQERKERKIHHIFW